MLLNLKGGNPLEGDGDPYPGWPSYCYPHLFRVLLGQVGECAKKVPDYWVGTAVQKYYFVGTKSKTLLLALLVSRYMYSCIRICFENCSEAGWQINKRNSVTGFVLNFPTGLPGEREELRGNFVNLSSCILPL